MRALEPAFLRSLHCATSARAPASALPRSAASRRKSEPIARHYLVLFFKLIFLFFFTFFFFTYSSAAEAEAAAAAAALCPVESLTTIEFAD